MELVDIQSTYVLPCLFMLIYQMKTYVGMSDIFMLLCHMFIYNVMSDVYQCCYVRYILMLLNQMYIYVVMSYVYSCCYAGCREMDDTQDPGQGREHCTVITGFYSQKRKKKNVPYMG